MAEVSASTKEGLADFFSDWFGSLRLHHKDRLRNSSQIVFKVQYFEDLEVTWEITSLDTCAKRCQTARVFHVFQVFPSVSSSNIFSETLSLGTHQFDIRNSDATDPGGARTPGGETSRWRGCGAWQGRKNSWPISFV